MTPPPGSGDLWLLLAVYAVALPVALGRLPLLCPAVFVAIGAAGTLQLQQRGWPLPIAVPTLAAGAAALGLLLAVPRRLGVAALAVGTWALGWFAQELWLDVPSLAGGAAGVTGPVPERLTLPVWGVSLRLTPWEIGLAAVPLVVAAAIAVETVTRDGTGLRLRFARDAADLVDALGGRRVADRRFVFGLTAFLAALAGCGLGVASGAVSPDDAGPLLSVQLVLAALVTGSSRWWGPLIGTGVLLGLDELATALPAGLDLTSRSALVTVAAFAVVLVVRRLSPRPGLRSPHATAARTTFAGGERRGGGGPAVTLDGVRVAFGPVTALQDVSVDFPAGRITGLVGANGSGKTTLLEVAAAALSPDAGTVVCDGRPVRPRDPAEMVRLGVVRTLQAGGLVESATVADHVRLGAASAATAPWWWLRLLAATPIADALRRRRRTGVEHALALTGLTGLAHHRVGELDTGVRPFVAVAAALATGAGLLLLDEPAAGLDRAGRERLSRLLLDLAGAGRGIVLVDHDLDLVASVADEVVVLSAGRVVGRGSPDEVDLFVTSLATAPPRAR